MLASPKGLEYWSVDKNGNDIIRADAPEWAKQEFEEYHRLMEEPEKPDEKGLINQI